MKLEVCCDHLESALIAQKSGADRIELCSSLSTGGLTPSLPMVQMVKESLSIPVMVLVRPRAGNFYYTAKEKELILREVEALNKINIDGVVVGALTKDKTIEVAFMKEVKKAAGKMELTFHRAFDFVKDEKLALQQIIDLDFDRILTSGLAKTALLGKNILKTLIERIGDELIIMPGSGINAGNIQQIMDYCNPREIHLSAKKSILETNNQSAFNIDYYLTDEEALKKIKKIVNSHYSDK